MFLKRLIIIIIALMAFATPVFAALAGTVQWDVRTTGSDSNGGCFDPGVVSPGTDYSQQTSPQVTFTDLVIGGTNTQLTSSGFPFSSVSPGNCIHITGGTGFTTGWYEVKSVSGATATMDRAVGTAASTLGTGYLGGSLLDVATAVGLHGTTGNTVWVKSGTYTYTTTQAWTAPIHPDIYYVIGYGSTHRDSGTAPLFTTATNSTNLVNVTGNQGWGYFENLAFSNTAGTSAYGLYSSSGANGLAGFFVKNCTFTGFSVALYLGTYNSNLFLQSSWISGSKTYAIQMPTDDATIVDSVIGPGSSDTAGILGVGGNLFLVGSIVAGHGKGISYNPGSMQILVVNSVIANNGGDGLYLSGSTGNYLSVANSIIYGNGGYGINAPTAFSDYSLTHNAFGSNTSAATTGIPSGFITGTITLTANPFVGSGSGNYALNTTAGGGASLRAAGYPGLFPNGTTTGYLDVGPVQHQDSGGGGATNSAYAN